MTRLEASPGQAREGWPLAPARGEAMSHPPEPVLPQALQGRWLRRAVDVAPRAGRSALLQRIEVDLPKLSPQLRKVAEHLVRERGLPHRYRITDFARLTDTTPVTVVRLAKRYGFQGFYELKFAFLLDDDGAPPAAMTDESEPSPSDPQSLRGAQRAIAALRSVVEHPAFMQTARWLLEADGVWVGSASRADEALAGCMVQSLQFAGLPARSASTDRLEAQASSTFSRSVHLHVALTGESPGTIGTVHSAARWQDRVIALCRAPQPAPPAITADERLVTLGLDIESADSALPAALGLIAAWSGAMRAMGSGH